MPVGGLESFNLYIEENIRLPEEDSLTGSPVVVLTFDINSEGRPINILVEESPGDAFNREAIRLLEEGPTWSPAYTNGTPIAKKNRLRIEFENR